MTKALALQKATCPRTSRHPPSLYAGPVSVVNRGGLLERDNGVCKNTSRARVLRRRRARARRDVQAERGRDPRRGRPVARRQRRRGSRASRSRATLVYKPARTGDRLGYVVGQFPTPRHGVGLRQDHARPGEVAARRRPESRRAHARRRRRRSSRSFTCSVHVKGGSNGRVVAQSLPPQTAAAPGLVTITSRVEAERAAEEARAGEAVAPRPVGGLRDPDPRARSRSRPARAVGRSSNGGRSSRQPVVLARHGERLAEPSRTRAEETRVGDPSPDPHLLQPRDSARSARSSTAPATPSSPQTMFRHQWIP